MRQQTLPPSWQYGLLSVHDREGRIYHTLAKPNHVEPWARKAAILDKPLWQVLPSEESDWIMHATRQALQGGPSHSIRAQKIEGRQLNGDVRLFEIGKGLVAVLAKNWWEEAPQSGKPPVECDALSQYYLSNPTLELSEPEFVWWVQETGFIMTHRSQLEMGPLPVFSQKLRRHIHIQEIFRADSAACIMKHIHAAFQTQEKQSFSLEESFENLLIVNSYTIYPLNGGFTNERDVVMMTRNMISSSNLDSQGIRSVG